MDYYSKILILKKYFNSYVNKKNVKTANKTLDQIKNLHGKIIEKIYELNSRSNDDNKLEILSDLERFNFKIINIIDECENYIEKNKIKDNAEDGEDDEDGEDGEDGEDDDYVENAVEKVKLKSSKLDKKLNSLVLFHAEWCGHCRKFMPIWDALSKLIPNSIINMVKISCVEKGKECEAIKEIKGYPTIIFVDMKNNKTITFVGQRNPESVIEFINECMGEKVLNLA